MYNPIDWCHVLHKATLDLTQIILVPLLNLAKTKVYQVNTIKNLKNFVFLIVCTSNLFKTGYTGIKILFFFRFLCNSKIKYSC